MLTVLIKVILVKTMIDKNTFARFVLTNDFSGLSVLTNEEFYSLESLFYNKDLSMIEKLPLWELVDIVDDKKLAEKIYLAFKTFDKSILNSLSQKNLTIITDSNSLYPERLSKKIKSDAPILIYTLGDATLLNKRSAAVIGARQIDEKGKRFAQIIGETIAEENKVLISGGANGSDFESTKSAIENGAKAIWFVAVSYDEIMKKPLVKKWIDENKLLVCWTFNPFATFNSKNALKRNRYIYANADAAFVCQVNSKISGTFSGANYCLKNNLCELFVFDNGTQAAKTLIENGAIAIYE